MHRLSYPPKLYVLVRGDIPPGLQYAQAVHAAVEHALAYPVLARDTRNVVVLNVLDEEDLMAAASLHSEHGALFREDDLDGEATAYATVCGDGCFMGLPLAGRELVRMET